MTSDTQELVSDVKLVSMCVGNSGKMHVLRSSSALPSHVTAEGTRKSSHDLIDREVSGPQHDLGQNDSTHTPVVRSTVRAAAGSSYGPALG